MLLQIEDTKRASMWSSPSGREETSHGCKSAQLLPDCSETISAFVLFLFISWFREPVNFSSVTEGSGEGPMCGPYQHPRTAGFETIPAEKVSCDVLNVSSVVHNLHPKVTDYAFAPGPYAKDVSILPLDLSDTSQIPRAVELAQTAFDGQGIDYVIHNAAYARPVRVPGRGADEPFPSLGCLQSFESVAEDLL